MIDLNEVRVVEHDLAPITPTEGLFGDSAVVELRVASRPDCYSCCGRLSNGDLIEMWRIQDASRDC